MKEKTKSINNVLENLSKTVNYIHLRLAIIQFIALVVQARNAGAKRSRYEAHLL